MLLWFYLNWLSPDLLLLEQLKPRRRILLPLSFLIQRHSIIFLPPDPHDPVSNSPPKLSAPRMVVLLIEPIQQQG